MVMTVPCVMSDIGHLEVGSVARAIKRKQQRHKAKDAIATPSSTFPDHDYRFDHWGVHHSGLNSAASGSSQRGRL